MQQRSASKPGRGLCGREAPDYASSITPPLKGSPPNRWGGITNIAQDFFRKRLCNPEHPQPAPDHRPSRLLVQQPLVFILCILCIDVHKKISIPWRRCRSIQVAEMGGAVPGVVRAGGPRSQEVFIHTKNREHGLHHAGESGKTPYASLEYHSPLEGESQTRAKPAVEPVGPPPGDLQG